MENQEIVGGKLGVIGSYDVAFKDGALVAELKVGGKDILDLIAKAAKEKLGSEVPVEVAQFLEKALGLA